MEIALLFGLAAVLLLTDVPIAVALGIAALVTIWGFGLAPLNVIPNIAYATVSKFTLLAVPFFIAAGYLMERSGIAERLVRFSELVVGHVRGGLAYVTIVVAIFFAGISGSGTADTAALGAILIPGMTDAGYRREFCRGPRRSGRRNRHHRSTEHCLCSLRGHFRSFDRQALHCRDRSRRLDRTALAVPSFFEARRFEIATVRRGTLKQLAISARRAGWGIAAPIIILGGIYSGIFTPTEAAGIVVVYALIVGMVIYRKFDPAHWSMSSPRRP